jgi:hypothetical protein
MSGVLQTLDQNVQIVSLLGEELPTSDDEESPADEQLPDEETNL